MTSNRTIAASFSLVPGVIAGQSTSTVICTPNPCVTIPVTLSRTYTNAVLAFHVTFQLSANLSLCAGTGSVIEGTFLSSAGSTLFHVTSNGGGSYTADGALTSNCGPTATSGLLFNVGVTSTDPGGTGMLTVTSATLRDCTNRPLAAGVGPVATVPIDNFVSALSDLAVAQVRTGNDADGTTKITVNYTIPADADHVEVWRKGFGGYPLYDNAGGSTPPLPASYPPPGWTLTGVTATGQTDEPPTRDFWYYVAYSKDMCGNAAVSNITGGTLNYHLGDVSDGVTAGTGDNKVATADLSLLGAHYGASGGALALFSYLDVGPTTDASVNGRPTTDGKADFEDLVMFALNFFPHASAPQTAARFVSSGEDEISLEAPDQVSAGEIFETRVRLAGAGDLQALSAALDWDHAVATPMTAVMGDLLAAQDGVMFSPAPGGVDAALLGIRERGLAGDGVLATVRFRALATGAPSLAINQVIGRDAANKTVLVKIGATRRNEPAVTSTVLMSAAPNPTDGNTLLQYSLARGGSVDLSIYSVDGRRIRTLVHGVEQPGQYQSTWDGTDEHGSLLRSGVFYLRLDAPGAHLSRMITLVR